MTPELAYWIFAGFAGVFGLLFGSFMNVCILRIPAGQSVVLPASHCPSCGGAIRAYDNVPVLAWLWLRGKCRDCGNPISALYPAIEALFGVLAVLLFRRVMPDLSDINTAHLVAYAWYFWLLFALVALTFIDLRHYIIPDVFSIYSIPVGIGGAWLLGTLGYTEAPTWQVSTVGALAGGLCLMPILLGYRMLTGQWGMGWGDPKLLALLGSYFGFYPGLALTIIVGSTSGSVIGLAISVARGRFRKPIPFGPFLALGALAQLYFGDEIFIAWESWITGMVFGS